MIRGKIVAFACITLLATILLHDAFHHHDDDPSPSDCASCLLLLVSHAMTPVAAPTIPVPELKTVMATDCTPHAPVRPDNTAALLRAPPVDRTACTA